MTIQREETEKKFDTEGIAEVLREIEEDFPQEVYALSILEERATGFLKPKMDKEEVERLTSKWKTAVECTKMFK